MANRYIGEGIRKVEYILNSCKTYNREGALLSIDFSKAFDSVSHDYMWETIRQFGFGDNMIHMIKTLYVNAESAVMNGGSTTKYFKLERRVRQGDCLSPYLFVLAIEPLLINIRNNESIEGIEYGGKTFKVAAYADDVTICLKSRESITETLNTFEQFGN